jgi:hypothetical protein
LKIGKILPGLVGLALFLYAISSLSLPLIIDLRTTLIAAFVAGMAGVMLMLIGSREIFGLLHDWQYERRKRNLGFFEDQDEIH